MSNEDYINYIVKMLKALDDNQKLKRIFEYVQRIFL